MPENYKITYTPKTPEEAQQRVAEARLAANRANAQRSTGPVTPEGKEVSKYNGVTHGLSSKRTVLAFENQPEFDSLLAAFTTEHKPIGPTEEALVHQIADAQWKLRRLGFIESAVFEKMMGPIAPKVYLMDPPELAGTPRPATNPYESIAGHMLESSRGQSALSMLMRYQATLNRQFMQSLKELRTIQDRRKAAEQNEAKRAAVHEITGIAKRSQPERDLLDIFADDPTAIIRYIETEANVLKAAAAAKSKTVAPAA